MVILRSARRRIYNLSPANGETSYPNLSPANGETSYPNLSPGGGETQRGGSS